jgi:ketosteroid isomerase-like protein
VENQTTSTQNLDPQAAIKDYLGAFEKHDLDRCLGFFADDATVSFMGGVFKGRSAIEEWHKERWSADLKITNVGQVKVKDQTVQLEVTVTSKRLKAFLVNNMGGRAMVRFDQGKIREMKLAPRMANIFGGGN